jgi:hypothetical protein
VSQKLSGISKNDFEADVNNAKAFKIATASILSVEAEDITIREVSDFSRRRLLSRKLQSGGIRVDYKVKVMVQASQSTNTVYANAKNAIVESTKASCSSNCFANALSSAVSLTGSSNTLAISSATTLPITDSDVGQPNDIPDNNDSNDSKPNMAPLIGGIVGGCVGLALIGVVFYHYHTMQNKEKKDRSSITPVDSAGLTAEKLTAVAPSGSVHPDHEMNDQVN